jgi:hypothetical protein
MLCCSSYNISYNLVSTSIIPPALLSDPFKQIYNVLLCGDISWGLFCEIENSNVSPQLTLNTMRQRRNLLGVWH